MTKFGLQIPNFSFGGPDAEMFSTVTEIATTAEAAGFRSLWVMDHFYQLPALGGADQPMLEAYTLLGALAAVTSTAKLGTLVTGVTYRNPAMLAKIITTLDVISKGRAVLGIGAAWHDVEHDALGFDFPSVRERMDRLEEAVQICRLMFRETVSSFEGRYYQTRDAKNIPRPISAGGPPIMIGGGGEKRTLRLVAQYADACNISGDVETVKHKIAVLRQHCADVGRDPNEIHVTRMATLHMTDSTEATEAARQFIANAAGPEALAAFHIGQEKEIVDQVSEFVAIGVDELIVNMPLSNAAGVRQAGELLTSAFS